MFDLDYEVPAAPVIVEHKPDFSFFHFDTYPFGAPDFGPDIAVIPLSQGFFALVKAEVAKRRSVKGFKWSADVRLHPETGEITQIYARRVEAVPMVKNGKPVYVESKGKMIKKRKCRTIYLHKVVVRAGRGVDVDHSNGYGPDCRDENLNAVSKSDNVANRFTKRTVNFGLPRGVVIAKTVGGVAVAWRGEIRCNYKLYKSRRVYDDPQRAHEWYKRAHRRLFEIQPWMRGKKKDRLPLPKQILPKSLPAVDRNGKDVIPF